MSKKYKKTYNSKYKTEFCDDSMSFQDCELAILRHAVDESEKIQGEKKANSEEIKKIIDILENFLISHNCICYGGTAINNILPKYAQFYNKEIEIPDYDFFSPNALEDAKELADIYSKNGYTEVEAKSGMHFGTFKVYVNFIPIADITYLNGKIFNAILKESITIAGIKYSPPNFLRMSMYLELSRPAGDVSRWEKILKRLNLLNEYYPFEKNINCETVDFQRELSKNIDDSELMYITTRDSFIEQGVVFFGGYASSLYSKYMNENERRKIKKIPDFDVLSDDPERCSTILIERLTSNGFKNVHSIKNDTIGELIPERIQINVGKDTIAYIYKPIACHNYNTIEISNKKINVATIDTMLSFYLAFIYTDDYMYFKQRILCMAKYLFQVEQKNRLEQKGLLKRFSLNCIGKQPTLEDIREEKTKKFEELSNNKNSEEYEMWFLKYSPAKKNNINMIIKEKEKPGKSKRSVESKKYSITNEPLKIKNKRKTQKKDQTKNKNFLDLFNLTTNINNSNTKKKAWSRKINRTEQGYLY
jgi:hypothetical protein